MADQCAKGVKNEQRIIALERDIGEIKQDIKDMKERLLGRPTWVITIIFTFLSSACIGLLLTLIRGLSG